MAIVRAHIGNRTWQKLSHHSMPADIKHSGSVACFLPRDRHISFAANPFLMTLEHSVGGDPAPLETELLETGKFAYCVKPKLPIATTWQGVMKATWCSSLLCRVAVSLAHTRTFETHASTDLLRFAPCKVTEATSIKCCLRAKSEV